MKRYNGLSAQNAVYAFFIIFLIFCGTAIDAQDWTTELPKDPHLEYFWGFSGTCRDEKEAAAVASQDARLRVSGSIFGAIESSHKDISLYKTTRGRITEDTNDIGIVSRYFTASKVTGIREEKRVRLPSANGVEIIILVSIETAAIQRAREEIAQEKESLSVYYTNEIEIIRQNSSHDLERIVRAYRQIASSLTPLQRIIVEYRGTVGTVNLLTYLEKQIKELLWIIREEYFSNARFYSIGAAAGSSFAAPWLIGTFLFTLSPLKYTIIEAGCDFGFLHGYFERNDINYHSFYPFAHIGPLIPLGEFFFCYTGVGGGYMIASY